MSVFENMATGYARYAWPTKQLILFILRTQDQHITPLFKQLNNALQNPTMHIRLISFSILFHFLSHLQLVLYAYFYLEMKYQIWYTYYNCIIFCLTYNFNRIILGWVRFLWHLELLFHAEVGLIILKQVFKSCVTNLFFVKKCKETALIHNTNKPIIKLIY